MSKTKIVGVLMIVSAVVAVAIDALDGNGFSFSSHADALMTAMNGAGFFFLRDAIAKIQNIVKL